MSQLVRLRGTHTAQTAHCALEKVHKYNLTGPYPKLQGTIGFDVEQGSIFSSAKELVNAVVIWAEPWPGLEFCKGNYSNGNSKADCDRSYFEMGFS